jgi:hypothetical protein
MEKLVQEERLSLNSQRGFHKEDDATFSHVLYKSAKVLNKVGDQMKMILKSQKPTRITFRL